MSTDSRRGQYERVRARCRRGFSAAGRPLGCVSTLSGAACPPSAASGFIPGWKG